MKTHTLRNRSVLTALVLAGGMALAPMGASAQQDELPSLEGTTYGTMIGQLNEQAQALEAAGSGQRVEALQETVSLMAHQNEIMIRMIDALHDQVDGILERDQSLVERGDHKFDQLGKNTRL